MTKYDTSAPVLLSAIRPLVLQSELDIYKKICVGRNISSISQAINISVIVEEITNIKDLDELRIYLITGEYGLTKKTVNRYISDLLFKETNQYN